MSKSKLNGIVLLVLTVLIVILAWLAAFCRVDAKEVAWYVLAVVV